MTTGTRAELLQVALEDLRLARCVIVNRLPEVARAVTDEETRQVFSTLVAKAHEEQSALAALVEKEGGDPNLWAQGILDDACRDVVSSAEGHVRDIALIGAIRKLLVADLVSLETAIALDSGSRRQCAPVLEDMRSARSEEDARLKDRLVALA